MATKKNRGKGVVIILFCLMLFLFFMGNVSAVKLDCYDDGSLVIRELLEKGTVEARLRYSRKPYFDVPGVWNQDDKYYYFYSDEAVFITDKPTKYTIKMGKRRYSVECPMFKFSCRMINISMEYCYTRDGLFVGRFMAYNFKLNKTTEYRFGNPFLLKYDVKTTELKTFSHGPEVLSKGFEDINMSYKRLQKGNKYTLRWKTPYNITRFSVSYDKCRQKRYNFYKSLECEENVAFCKIDKDCYSNEYCEDGVCTAVECERCKYPINHSCVSYECCGDSDCKENKKCEEHRCVEFSCKEGEYVFNHTCLKLDCKEDEYISNNSCKKLFCDEDEYVENHQCRKLECRDNEYAQNHTCNKLQCKFFQKSYNHRCVNYFLYLWKSMFKT
jgi:hypothetical protein